MSIFSSLCGESIPYEMVLPVFGAVYAPNTGKKLPRREKTCLWVFANNTGADQPAHWCSLISTFVFRFLESTICKLATSEISIF